MSKTPKPNFDLEPADRVRLAESLGLTSDAMLRHLQVGRRRASADTAIKIERTARKMRLHVPRESICDACAGCEYLKAAKAAKK